MVIPVVEKLKKVRITRPIIVDGTHAEVGDVHTVPHGVALDLIGSGSAEDAGEGAAERDPQSLTTRTEDPQNGDPEVEHRDPAAHRRAQGSSRK